MVGARPGDEFRTRRANSLPGFCHPRQPLPSTASREGSAMGHYNPKPPTADEEPTICDQQQGVPFTITQAVNGDGATPESDRARSAEVSTTFLEKLRPGGPWVLTAIVPDEKPTTITVHTADEVEAFVREHDGKANLYYSVNPTRNTAS